MNTPTMQPSGHPRDAALRRAHQQAFDKISAAAFSLDHRVIVAQAVEELVDACQAYVEAR